MMEIVLIIKAGDKNRISKGSFVLGTGEANISVPDS